MLELPRGLWRWLDDNARDVGRIASAVEKAAEELTAIRRELEKDDQEEES